MNHEFKECLRKRYLVEIPVDNELVKKEIKGAEYDLNRARNSFNEGDYKWCIVQSDYCMFHTTKALVFSRGYREKRHYCLLIAFRTLFVDTDLMNGKYAVMFEESMNLREEADYSLVYSKEAAEESISNAEELLKKAKSVLKSK